MLLLEIDEANHIAVIEPSGSLLKYYFESVSRVVDDYIGLNNPLKGLVIYTKNFQGGIPFLHYVIISILLKNTTWLYLESLFQRTHL